MWFLFNSTENSQSCIWLLGVSQGQILTLAILREQALLLPESPPPFRLLGSAMNRLLGRDDQRLLSPPWCDGLILWEYKLCITAKLVSRYSVRVIGLGQGFSGPALCGLSVHRSRLSH